MRNFIQIRRKIKKKIESIKKSTYKFKNLKLIKIYLIPPNRDELKQRLIKRNLDPLEEVEKRFKAFEADVLHWKDYDYVLINENLDNCYKQIEKIILLNKSESIDFLK